MNNIKGIICNKTMMYKDEHNKTTNDSEMSEIMCATLNDISENPTNLSLQLEESTKLRNILIVF